MPIPMLPLVLLGVGVLVLRSKKAPPKRRPEPTEPEDAIPVLPIKAVYIPPPSTPKPPAPRPGQPCDAPDGKGARDEHGDCKTFWINGVTDDAIRTFAREEWEARGRPSFSDLCLAVYDELDGELGAHGPNPRFTEIVVAALQRYYGVGALFPPTTGHGGHDPTSPYWVHEAWAKATHVVQQELCTP